ncbi:MAG: hypothetical protein LBE54_11745, partial [Brucellaceae bacterium]|nr:hypothetical protein [Brucellaceae bacterium]
MTVPVPDRLEFISEGNGVLKEFSYPRRFLQKDEIVVAFRKGHADTIKGLNIDYTIAGSSWPNGGSIVFTVAPPVGVKVVRYRKTQAKQTVDLDNNQRNDAKAVELQLDRLTMALQDTDVLARSAVRTDNKEGYRLSPPVPEKLLGWDEQGKAIISSSKTVRELDDGIASAQKAAEEAVAAKDTTLEAIDQISGDLTTVIEMRPEIQAVISDKANIGTVAGNIGNVNKVAVIDAAVSKVAAIDTAVSKVAAIDTDVSRVSSISTDVQTVAGDRVNINAVADNKTNIDTVAGSKTNIDAVAGNKLNIDAVAGNATNINVVSAHATEVDTVASNMARVIIVSDNMGKVATVSVIAAEVVEVADIKAAVQAVAAIGEDVQTVSRNIASVVNVAGNKTNIDIVALNIADIQNASQNMAAIKAAPDAATRSETAAGKSKEYRDEALAVFANMKGGAVGYALVKRSAADYDYEWLEITGLGDMTKAIFDPTGVNGDAFSMGNMVETATAKIMTNTERTRLAGMANGATANIGTVTSVAVAVPAGFTVSGAITTSGTITIGNASGYQAYTTAEANKLAGINLALYQTLAVKGLANGYAGLDAAGKVPTAQLPDTVLGAVRYIGVWDAATNSPAIPAASANNKGWYYMVSVTGTTNIDGNGEWVVGDWIVSNGVRWDRVKNVDAVIDVAGLRGSITAAALKIALNLQNVANKSEAQMVASGAIADSLEGKLPSNAQAADSARLGNKTAVQWQTEVDALKNQFFGNGQVWQSVSRPANTVFQNTTGRTIFITVNISSGYGTFQMSPDNVNWSTAS